MKYFKIVILLTCFIGSGLLISCKDKPVKTEQNAVKGKEYTSKYICPMHCEGSGDSEMGICPVCRMDYELNEEYTDTK